MKVSKVLVFLGGIVISLVIFVIVAGNTFLFYRVTNALVEKGISILEGSKPREYDFIQKDFNLSFESTQEMNIFDVQQAGMEISNKFASLGQNSLMVEFPADYQYPGITFDLFGKECLNWSTMQDFSFDVYNSVELDTGLTVQIRSGENYPKKEFKKDYRLDPIQWTTIRIGRDELGRELDLGKISHLTIFMPSVPTTFKLYFDNMKMVKNEE